METLRQQDVFDPADVRYAIAETNGSISVFTRSADGFALVPIVNDGKLVEWGMRMTGVSGEWVEHIIRSHHCTIDEVLLLSADRDHHHTLIKKEEAKP